LSIDRKAVVLVAENETRIRIGLARVVREADFAVIEAANADHALDILRNGTAVDIIVSDIRMPGAIDGVGLAAVVAREFPSIKVLLTSGHEPANLPSHIEAFLLKPIRPGELLRRLDALVRCESRMT
jgi:two-component system, response regulator PdtaR